MSIVKGQTHFQMGIKNIEQLEVILEQNPEMVGIAFVGRSNVGKSSLINCLFGKKTAKTSKTPGRTREINIFSFETDEANERDNGTTPFILFDLPGYGHAEVSKAMAKNWDMLMTEFFAKLPKSIAILNIQDSRHPNQKVDQHFHQFLKNQGLTTHLILNKIDKLKKQKEKSQLQKEIKKIKEYYLWVDKFIKVSAESKEGVDLLEKEIIDYCLEQSHS